MKQQKRNNITKTKGNPLAYQLKQRDAELLLLNSIQEAINDEIGMQGIYNMVGNKLRDLFDAQVVGIYTINHDEEMEIFNFLYEDGELLKPKPRKLDAVRKLVIDKKELILIDTDLAKKVAEIIGVQPKAVPGTRLPKSILFVPMMVRNEVFGYVSIQNLDREQAFSKDDVKLLKTIANSMSVGLENARLFNEAEQRNAELAVINSVQQGLVAEMDMQGIYELIGNQLRDLFDAQVTGIYSFNQETEMEHFHYLFEDGERLFPEPRPLNQIRYWLIKNKKLLLVNEDADNDIYKITNEKHVPVPGTRLPKSMLFVPLIVGNDVKGCVSLQNLDREHAFKDADVRLMTTLANSMSVALENARLFNEAEQRNAELAVINSVQQGLVAEMDMQGIYQLVGEKLRTLFDAQVVAVCTFNHKENIEDINYVFEDGQQYEIEPRPIDTFRKKMIASRKLIYLNENADKMWTEITGEKPTVIPGTKFTKSALYVPMIVGKNVKGYVSLQNVESENAFSESDIRLLSTLANSMTSAIENARLFNETTRLLEETKQRATELETVNKISHALVSQLDLKSLIKLIGDQMLQTFNADIVYLAIHDKKADMLHFPYMFGEDEVHSRLFGNGITEKIILSKEPLLINEDMDRAYEEIKADRKGKWMKSFLGVPIIVGNEATGVISVQSTENENRFNEYDLRLLKTIAANVGVAMQNAEAYEKLQAALTELESAQEQLIQQEKLASLGQLSAGIAHEIKNPLNFVNNFSELNLELIDEIKEELSKLPSSAEKKEIQIILEDIIANQKKIYQHGTRADSIVKSMLLHSRGGDGTKEAIDLNLLLKEYVNLSFHGMRAGKKPINVSLDFQLDDTIPKSQVIIEDMSRVILNLCNNAFDAMYEKLQIKNSPEDYQPRLSIKTYKNNNQVSIEIADNALGISVNLQDKILMPFFTTKRGTEGTGLGLSITNDIVKAHGGNLQIDSKQGKNSFTKFIINLPI